MQLSYNGLYMYIGSLVLFLVTYIAMICFKGARRSYPGNVILLSAFTLALSVMVSSVTIYHDAIWVMTAIGLTAMLCLGLSLFAMQTKYDFTGGR